MAELFSEVYIKKLQNDIEQAKKENYKDFLSKNLFELELPDTIVDKLIKKVNQNLNIIHKNIKFKKKMSELDEYHMFDLGQSILNIPKIKYPLEKALEIIKSSLSILGDDYIKLIDKMFDEGWIDLYPNDNKRTMSYTCFSYNGVPYVLTNYNSSFDSVVTLAHEIGHSTHVYYSKINNEFENFDPSIFLSEIIAKVNELLVYEYVIHNCKDKEEKLYLTNEIVNRIENSLFNQTMNTEFEHNVINKLSKNEIVDSTYLNNLYMDLIRKYKRGITFDDNLKYGWSKIPHFIMMDTYYMFQYSIGISVATNIVYRILNNEKGIVDKYKKFLSFGNSVSIKEALSYLDIDLEDKKMKKMVKKS